jgi:transcriptional regulator of acetoin/glycerol metabolism
MPFEIRRFVGQHPWMGWQLPHDSAEETVDSTAFGAAQVQAAKIKGRLAIAHPHDLHVTIDLADDRTILGRQPDERGSPAINHKTVSRSHFAIEWDEGLGTHVGRDLGSRNGSWVDGQEAKGGWHPMKEGSVIRTGDVILIYERGHTLSEADAPDVSRAAVPGDALAIRRLRATMARAAPDVSPALIIGETGTGKEMIAQELHVLSGRKGQFVAINCATLGEQLIESQLFGHVKGSFTGATTDHEGLFRAAEGGTLFLDEIGELPMPLQPKLLRAIQEKEIMSVGSTKTERVDARVVAATHRNLGEKARSGQFRQDLYARLALWELSVPSVRERRADVVRWLDLMQAGWNRERGIDEKGLDLTADAAETLISCDWPENLRGLNRFVHEMASRKSTDKIRRGDLPEWIFAPAA